MKTRMAIVGTAGIPARYGGFETLAEQLSGELASLYDITVFCSSTRYRSSTLLLKNGTVRLQQLPFRANGMLGMIYDGLSVILASRNNSILMLLGVAGAWALPVAYLFGRTKIVVNTDGVEWRRKKWSPVVRILLKALELISVRFAHSVVADNKGIANIIRRRYGVEPEVIAYGGDHLFTSSQGPGISLSAANSDSHVSFLQKRGYYLSVSRIEPENNVPMILKAFSELSDRELIYVGNWDVSPWARALRAMFGRYTNIHCVNPIYDPAVMGVMRHEAIAYIHGHSAGGTNPSLVEAMHCGAAVYAFDIVFNRFTTDSRALFFSDAEGLKRLIAFTSAASNTRVGKEMRRLALERYTWKDVAEQYDQMLKNVTGN